MGGQPSLRPKPTEAHQPIDGPVPIPVLPPTAVPEMDKVPVSTHKDTLPKPGEWVTHKSVIVRSQGLVWHHHPGLRYKGGCASTQRAESRGSCRRSLPKATERVLVPLRQLKCISLHLGKDWYTLTGEERTAVLWHRPSRHSSISTMVLQDDAEKCPPGKEQGESEVSLPTAPHGWQRGSRSSTQRPRGRVPPLMGQQGKAGLWAPVLALPLGQPSRDRARPWGQSCRDISPALQRCSHHLLSLSPMCTLCHRAEADAKSSSSLSGQPRPDQARRRAWRQRAQGSDRQTAKHIRLNRMPLLRAEASSPRTAAQEVTGLSLVSSSSSSSFPCQKQGLKRGHPEGATVPKTLEGPPAKRCRIVDVPAWSVETSSSSTASQVALRLSQDTQQSRRQAAPYRPPWLFPGSVIDNRSQPGPIRMRHVWQQQRRAKKPYSRPINQSRTRRASACGAQPPHASK